MARIKSGAGLFTQTKVQRSSLDIMAAESQIGVLEIDRGTSDNPQVTPEITLDLVLNEGRGFGSQQIPESDLQSVADALQEIVEADFYREEDPEGYQPPADVIRRTWKMVHPRRYELKKNEKGELKEVAVPDTTQPKDWVSFQTRGGQRGVKPAVIHKSELPTLIEVLRTKVQPQLDTVRAQCWATYDAAKETDTPPDNTPEE